jgi:signal transduction histidine kinase
MHGLLAQHLTKCFGRTDGFSPELTEFLALVERKYAGAKGDNTWQKPAEAEHAALQSQLIAASRRAGMAEIATGVLHNVGNVLNSINTGLSVASERLTDSKLPNVGKVAQLLLSQRGTMGDFLTTDERGIQIPGYLNSLAEHLAAEQSDILKELSSLASHVEHIRQIVAMQQNHAKITDVNEPVNVAQLIDDVLAMEEESLRRHRITVVRQFDPVGQVLLDKHQMMQILINLTSNARAALREAAGDRTITVRLAALQTDASETSRFVVEVRDNGAGIPSQNMTRIFSHGFTTRPDGHGFGLHTSALAARSMGGSLSAASDGAGAGAAFTLELPLKAAGPSNPSRSAA